MLQDRFGCPLRAGDTSAVALYDLALGDLLNLRGDPVAMLDQATQVDPGLLMAHVCKGLLCVLGTEKAFLPDALAALANARAVGTANPRERLHVEALAAWTEGRLQEAVGHWETILLEQPDDALALFAAHQGDFFLGQSNELRDRVARRLGLIDAGTELYGHYLGMYAFGLEETGNYASGEDIGRQAVALCPQDGWAIHAVAHVLEMDGRAAEGIRWLDERRADWSEGSFFAVHNWWHLSLYHFDRQDWQQVLALYDARIGTGSAVVLDMLDASALLWRLTLHGIDVGERWQPLVALWEPLIEDGWYGFNDMHAMMAFAAAGRDDLAERLLTVMAATAAGQGDNARTTRAVALPVARALLAFCRGDPAEAVRVLVQVKGIAARSGGSHAQRDLLAQTLIVAAQRAGERRMALALLHERLALKPGSELNRHWLARAKSTR